MRRKRLWIGGVLAVVLVIAGLALSFFAAAGHRRIGVCLGDFVQTEDTVTIQVVVPSSMGYVRACEPRVNSGGNLTLGFYSTYGLNSRRGAKDTFTIETPEGCDTISFERSNGVPYIVLVRDSETGLWQKWGGQ